MSFLEHFIQTESYPLLKENLLGAHVLMLQHGFWPAESTLGWGGVYASVYTLFIKAWIN